MGELAVHPGNKGFESVATDKLSCQRLRLFFSFCLEQMLFCSRGGAIFGSNDIETDLYLAADGQRGALPKLVQIVFLNPVLINGVFHPQDKATRLVA